MKTALFLASVVLSLIACEASPAPECSWGPSYWCQSKATAKQCGQEVYCNNEVWKATINANVKVGTVECDVCKLVIGRVQKIVGSNTTEEGVKNVLEEVCSDLKSLKDECDMLLNTFFPQIWQMIVSEVDPASICAEVKLCTSLMAKAAKVEFKVGAVECDVCKLVIGLVQKEVKAKSTEDDAQKAVMEMCSVLGSLKEECETLLTTFFPQIWEMVVNELDPTTICSELKLCTSSVMAKTQVANVGSVQCDVCKIVVTYLQKFFNNNKTEAEAQHEVEKLCNTLGSLKDECDTLVSDFFPQIWDMVVKQMDPSTVCSTIGLCTTKEIAEPLALFKVRLGGECKICKKVVETLEKLVRSHTAEDVAMDAVKEVCVYLGPLDHECKDVIDKYFPQMWQLLQQKVSAGEVCEKLKLCSSKKKAVAASQSIPPVKSIECDYCKIIAMYMNKFVSSNRTEAEAKQEVKDLCSMMGSASGECNSVVDLFFDQIWKMLEEETEPDVICNLLKLCTNKSVKSLKHKVALPKQTLCDLCELVVRFLKTYVDSNTTENEVKAAVENLCNILPGGLKDECTTLVEDEFDTIWELVESEFDNNLICKQLGICNSTMSLVKLPAIPKPKIAMPRQTACDVCKIVVTFIKPYVDSNATQDKVKSMLNELCNILPGNYSRQCNTILSVFFPTIWDMVKKDVDDGEICNQLNLCSSTSSTTKDTEVLKSAASDHPVSVGDNTLCIVCKEVSGYIRDFVENNATKEEAKKAVTEFCTKVPSPYNSSCLTLIDTYFDMIWNLIDSYVEDDDLCNKLNLCNSSAVAASLDLKEEISGPLCLICEFVMKELDSMLDSNTTEAEIRAALNKVCNILPKTAQDDCNDFVNRYEDDIIKLLLEAVSPKLICTIVHACSATKLVVMPVAEEASLKDECSICKVVLGFVKTLIEDYKKPIEEALNDVCGLMPSTIKSECATFVKEFGPEIVQIVGQELNPEQICKDLNLCTGSALMAPWKKLARAKSI